MTPPRLVPICGVFSLLSCHGVGCRVLPFPSKPSEHLILRREVLFPEQRPQGPSIRSELSRHGALPRIVPFVFCAKMGSNRPEYTRSARNRHAVCVLSDRKESILHSFLYHPRVLRFQTELSLSFPLLPSFHSIGHKNHRGRTNNEAERVPPVSASVLPDLRKSSERHVSSAILPAGTRADLNWHWNWNRPRLSPHSQPPTRWIGRLPCERAGRNILPISDR